MTPRANTHDAVVAYVNHAADLIAKNGPSCETFAKPEWASGDWYVFVQEPDGNVIRHPNAQIVGRPAADIVDANGMHVGAALASAGASGHGWVEYVWPRPGTSNPVAKSTYVTSVKGPDGKTYYVGAGGYELK